MESTAQTTNPSRVELSFDIYLLVIDHAADSWPRPERDLKALSLTHRSLVVPCQKRLFEAVGFSIKAAKKLVEIHNDSPHLATYVRELSFSTNHKEDKNRPTEVVVAFLNKFRHLRKLFLDFRISEFNPVQYDWTKLDRHVAAALLDLLRSQPQLQTLSIHMIRNFPSRGLLSLADCGQHLQDLTIHSLTIDSTDVMPPPANAEDSGGVPGNLARCTIGPNTCEALAVLTGAEHSPCKNRSVLDFSTLEYMFAEWRTDEDIEGTTVLMKSSPHLRKLHCELPKHGKESFRGLSKAILGGPFQAIREITLSSTESEESEDLYGLSRSLARLSGNVNALEVLDISLNIYCREADSVISETCIDIARQCQLLDKILATENAFPALRRLSIYIILSILDDPQYTETVLERQLKKRAALVEEVCFKKLPTLDNLRFSFMLEMEWAEF